MKAYQLLFLSIAAIFVAACSGSSTSGEELSLADDFDEIEINNQYKMHIPDYMEQAYTLNEEASLQYQNIVKETYCIIIDEPKDEFVEVFELMGDYDNSKSVIDNYSGVQVGFLTEGIDVSVQTDPKSKKINGLAAVIVEIEGMAQGVLYEIFYYLTFIEGADDLYMIMAWTLQESKDEYKATFAKMVESFEEL
ncbi:hypothetical protein JYT74_02655 [Crocinitomix catalasitica]|nr:hypothetical protein [Crocinitomix catalasitica]